MLYFIVGPGKRQTKVVHGTTTEPKYGECMSRAAEWFVNGTDV